MTETFKPTDYDSCVLVEGFPQFPAAKSGLLKSMIVDQLLKISTEQTLSPKAFTIPVSEETQKTMGVALLYFTSTVDAGRFILYNRDKSFRLTLKNKTRLYPVKMDFLSNFMQAVADAEAPSLPTRAEFTDPDPVAATAWVRDELARPQLVLSLLHEIRGASEAVTTVSWFDAVEKFSVNRAVDNGVFTSTDTEKPGAARPVYFWSPHGTYLCVVGSEGGSISFYYGDFGEDDYFELPVPGLVPAIAKHIAFSPCERFLLTPRMTEAGREFALFHLATGQDFYAFPTSPSLAMPSFSASGKFIARGDREKGKVLSWMLSEDGCGPAIKPLPQGPIRAAHIRDCQWAPAGGDTLAIFCQPAADVQTDAATHFSLYRFAKGAYKALNNTHLENSTRHGGCVFVWQPEGNYFGVLATTDGIYQPPAPPVKKRGRPVMPEPPVAITEQKLYILKLAAAESSTAGVPTDVISFSTSPAPTGAFFGRALAVHFAFEPSATGSRLALTLRRDSRAECHEAATVRLSDTSTPQLEHVFNCRAANIYWSPAGRVAAFVQPRKEIIFYDSANKEVMNAISAEGLTAETMNAFATHFEWEPTGRYLLASNCEIDQRGPNTEEPSASRFQIYDHCGRSIFDSEQLKRVSLASWRPLPKLALSAADVRDIHTHFKELAPPYREQDAARRARAAEELRQHVAKHTEQYQQTIAAAVQQLAAEVSQEQRLAVRGSCVTLSEKQMLEAFQVLKSSQIPEQVAKA